MSADRARVTDTLQALAAAEGADGLGSGSAAAAALMPLVYEELRALAAVYLAGERPGGTLQATALVHEAYLRLVDIDRIDWRGKTHFFAMAATQMRRILVEHARARAARKRGGGARRVTLDETVSVDPGNLDELLALDEALTRLADLDARQARVAELRLFAGLSVAEAAAAIGFSERTVKGDWRVARAWLLRELGEEG